MTNIAKAIQTPKLSEFRNYKGTNTIGIISLQDIGMSKFKKINEYT